MGGLDCGKMQPRQPRVNLESLEPWSDVLHLVCATSPWQASISEILPTYAFVLTQGQGLQAVLNLTIQVWVDPNSNRVAMATTQSTNNYRILLLEKSGV